MRTWRNTFSKGEHRFLTFIFLFNGLSGITQPYTYTNYVEEFQQKDAGWKTGTQRNISFEYESVKGNVVIKNTDLKALKILRKDLPHDPGADFTIETSLIVLKATDRSVFGLVWGYEYWSDHHSVWFSYDNTMQYNVHDCKTTVKTIKRTMVKSDLKEKGFKNEILITKRGDSLLIQLNKKTFIRTKYTGHEGNELGFILDAGMTMSVDYLKVKHAEKKINLIPDAVNGYKKENLGANINSTCVEIQPVISADGKMLLFSRDECAGNNGSNLADIFSSEKNDAGDWQKPVRLSKSVNNEGHNFVVTVTPDLSSLLIGNTYNANGTAKGQGVSLSVKRNGQWSIPSEQIIKEFKNYNRFVTYFLTTDGNRLLMSIENFESKGDLDLFISQKQSDNTWSKPVNMGSVLNTYAQEYSPFIAPDGKTLFFSSKGHAGYGSSDVFVSKRLDDTWLNWSIPKNLGNEINTPLLDGYYTVPAAGEYAYLISDESGFGREDIFRIKVPQSAKPEATTIIEGKVIDQKTNQPINAEIYYEDLNDPSIHGTAYADKTDGYKIILPGGKFYGFTAKAKGYISASKNIDLKDLKQFEERTVDILVAPIEAGQKARLNNIFFDVNKAVLRKESSAELDRLVTTLKENVNMRIEVGGHTDTDGQDAANLDLSLRRALAVMNYLLGKGIAKERLTHKGYGETMPVAPNTTDEGKQLNRRVEITVLK